MPASSSNSPTTKSFRHLFSCCFSAHWQFACCRPSDRKMWPGAAGGGGGGGGVALDYYRYVVLKYTILCCSATLAHDEEGEGFLLLLLFYCLKIRPFSDSHFVLPPPPCPALPPFPAPFPLVPHDTPYIGSSSSSSSSSPPHVTCRRCHRPKKQPPLLAAFRT
jgi:hypothetical protein